MRTVKLILLSTVCMACLPALASAQTGACTCLFSVDDGQEGFACTDDADAELCSLLCTDGEWELLEGDTCEDVPDAPWDGACFFDGPPERCWLWWVGPNSVTPQESCEDVTGEWLGDGSSCQQVPTLPKVGQAALVLILLVGALVILTRHGTVRPA